jgi:phosphoglycerate dehydrogenase-like enzyme
VTEHREDPATFEPATVLITWPDYDDAYPRGREQFANIGATVRYEPKLGSRTSQELHSLLDGVQAAIVSTDPFTADVLEAHPHLRVIARVGVGVDSIDVTAATYAGIAVTTTVGANEATVADHTIALILAALRDIPGHNARVRAGQWERTGRYLPSQLTGRTVLLLGYGHIGRLVAQRLAGFDVTLLVCDPATEPEPRLELVDLAEGLRLADVVSLHLPLTSTTRGLLGREQLQVMRRGAVLINTARGGIVDEQALIDFVRSGHIRAAALDVFANEPPDVDALSLVPQIIASPHVGGLSDVSIAAMLELATESVIEALSGRFPNRAINSDAFVLREHRGATT